MAICATRISQRTACGGVDGGLRQPDLGIRIQRTDAAANAGRLRERAIKQRQSLNSPSAAFEGCDYRIDATDGEGFERRLAVRPGELGPPASSLNS